MARNLGLAIAARTADPGLCVRAEAAVEAIELLHGLPLIEVLIPPPGSPDVRHAPPPESRASTSAASPMLGKVRNLLAKAESTTFEAEAVAFTAKAHELMTRHAIDEAAVAGDRDVGAPATIRLPVDAPYVSAKLHLLHVVAKSNRCASISFERFAMASVVGFPDDISGVEILFTSLLLQAQTAMNAAAYGPAGSHHRSRSFRSSFLYGFAVRIGERLRPASIDGAGWAGGRIAADNARLGAGELR